MAAYCAEYTLLNMLSAA